MHLEEGEARFGASGSERQRRGPSPGSLQAAPAAAQPRSPDARLVARILEGDAEAGGRFIRDHYAGIYRFLLRLTGNRETAEDLAQETFVEAWRSLPGFEGRAPLRLWLFRIAHRQFLQLLRSRRPQTSLDDVPPDREPRAAEATDAVELREIIRGLPLEAREVVVLHYLEGYNCEEISQILGIPAGTVKYRLFEARARLRRDLGGEGPETGRSERR